MSVTNRLAADPVHVELEDKRKEAFKRAEQRNLGKLKMTKVCLGRVRLHFEEGHEDYFV